MPRLDILQYTKARPVGLLDENKTGTASIGAGQVQTPELAKPAYMQFVPEDSNAGLQIGTHVANVAEEIYNRSVKQAYAQGKLQGQQKAASNHDLMMQEYYGTPDKPGIVDSTGQEFIDKSMAWEQKYSKLTNDTLPTLSKYAQSEFLSEATRYRYSAFEREQTVRVKEQREAAANQRGYINTVNTAELATSAFDRFQNGATDISQYQDWFGNLQYEAVRRAQQDGLNNLPADKHDALLKKHQDDVILETLTSMYAAPGGDKVAGLVEKDLISSITNPDLQVKAKGLYAKTVNQLHDNYKAENDLIKAQEEQQLRQDYQGVITVMRSLKDKNTAQQYVSQQYQISEAHGARAQKIFESLHSKRELSTEERQIMIKGLTQGKSSVDVLIENPNFVGNAEALDKLDLSHIAGNKEIHVLYEGRLEATLSRLIEDTSNGDPKIFATMFGAAHNTEIFSRLKQQWHELAQKTPREQLESTFTNFINTNLNADFLKADELKWAPNKSFVPWRTGVGDYNPKTFDSATSYTSLASKLVQNPLAETTLIKGKPASFWLNTLAPAAEGGDKEAERLYWKTYKILQQSSFEKANPPQNFMNLWLDDVSKQIWSYQNKFSNYSVEQQAKQERQAKGNNRNGKR